MGKQHFPFRDDSSPSTPPKGLLERADDLFHFGEAIKGKNLPPLDIPAELIPPEPTPPAAEAVATSQPLPEPGGAPVGETGAQAAPARHALVPVFRARDWTGTARPLDREAMAEAGYLVPGAPVTALAEEFRIVKREVLGRMRGGRKQTAVPHGNIVLITSAQPGEGKTFCAINLAVSLAAEQGLEVLLVDADFAQPKILQALGIAKNGAAEDGEGGATAAPEPAKGGRPSDPGLMDALADPTLAVEDLVIRTDVPSLSVLGAGSGSRKDTEFLSSARTDAILSALVSGRPDRIVLFDSSPLLATSAPAALANHVGQVLLVVRADRTTEATLRDAAGLLSGCGTVELLLNGARFSTSRRQYGSYYGGDA